MWQTFCDWMWIVWCRPVRGYPLWGWLVAVAFVITLVIVLIGTFMGYDMISNRCNSYGDCLYDY